MELTLKAASVPAFGLLLFSVQKFVASNGLEAGDEDLLMTDKKSGYRFVHVAILPFFPMKLLHKSVCCMESRRDKP